MIVLIINIVHMSRESGGRKSWRDMTPQDFDRKSTAPPPGVHPEPMFPIPDDCGTEDLTSLLEL